MNRRPWVVLEEDLKAQREGILSLGFWALLVYRFGHARYVVRSRWVRLPLTVVYLLLNKLVEIFCGMSIGGNAKIGRRFVIEHQGGIVVHGACVIGDDCIIRQAVTLGNRHLDQPNPTPRLAWGIESMLVREQRFWVACILETMPQ
ncbi:hypothetical protein [Polaromonas hydrogenivorans]|uniref:Serine acetyltransferase n=1 Tax=Polaromonas hydrogenivorans TaxID=335476 RepID=A0AAU7LU53_9BURK